MKKFFFLLIFILLHSSSNLLAEEKIVFLDFDYVLTNSNKGKLILDDLEKINKKNISTLKAKEESLKKEELTINSKKNIITKDEFNQSVTIFRKKIKKFRDEKNDLVKNFNNLKKKEIENLISLINPILTNYVEQNSIDIVFEKKNILLGKKDYDITGELLKVVNNQLKK